MALFGLETRDANLGMRYSVYQRIVFPSDANMPSLDYLDMVLEDCRNRLRSEGVGTLNADIQIRPWPRSEKESSRKGYYDSVPRRGLDIVMTSVTDAI